MATTPNRAYPYPTSGDNVDVPEDMLALATALDTEVAAVMAAWTAFTPVFQTDSGSPAIGTGGGASAAGRYKQIGKMVHYRGRIQFGSSGFSAGTGSWYITLPVAARADTAPDIRTLGVTYMRDDSASGNYNGFCQINPSLNAGRLILFSSASPSVAISGTVPFTWANPDHISWNITYEAA